MVKKSNVLMLSYIIFLSVSVFASVAFEWPGIHRTALAATIAGCFFAVADLANWYVSYQKLIIARRQEQIAALRTYGEKLIEKTQVQQKTMTKTLGMLAPYQYDESIQEIITKCKQGQTMCIEKERSNREAIEEIDREDDRIAIKIAETRKIQYAEILCSISGFVVFFSLISFNAINSFFAEFASHATVIAFILIMLTYFLKDFFEEKELANASKIEAFFEKCRKGVAEAEEIINKQDYTETVQKLIDVLEEEKENG